MEKAIKCLQHLLFLSPVLFVQTLAMQFTKEPKSQDALHGRSAMLRCEVSNPTNVSYRWLHNGQRLENSERRFQEGSNLKFMTVDRQLDAGSYECIAQNPVTGEIRQSTNASFNIKCEYLSSSHDFNLHSSHPIVKKNPAKGKLPVYRMATSVCIRFLH